MGGPSQAQIVRPASRLASRRSTRPGSLSRTYTRHARPLVLEALADTRTPAATATLQTRYRRLRFGYGSKERAHVTPSSPALPAVQAGRNAECEPPRQVRMQTGCSCRPYGPREESRNPTTSAIRAPSRLIPTGQITHQGQVERRVGVRQGARRLNAGQARDPWVGADRRVVAPTSADQCPGRGTDRWSGSSVAAIRAHHDTPARQVRRPPSTSVESGQMAVRG
jgi:hypothetical protein